MRTMKLLAATVVPMLMTALPAFAAQSGYPDKPIRLVLGSAAGSGPDIISRVMADRLYKVWNQRIVVDPRPGVAGILSADIVNRSTPDGYTWMMLTSQLLVATQVYSNHKVNLAKDFASISLIGTVPFVLVGRGVQVGGEAGSDGAVAVGHAADFGGLALGALDAPRGGPLLQRLAGGFDDLAEHVDHAERAAGLADATVVSDGGHDGTPCTSNDVAVQYRVNPRSSSASRWRPTPGLFERSGEAG